MSWSQRAAASRQRFSIPLRLVVGLAVLVVLGTLALMAPGVSTRPLALNEAFFTAVSALSVTGLSIITPVTDLTLLGQVILLVLIQIGGVGFMVVAVLVFRLLGRRISHADRLALTDSFGLLMPGAILRLTRRVVLTVLLIEGSGALFLWLHWRELLGPDRALFYALFHAVSAFCNAGFDLFFGLPEFPDGIPNDNLTLLILGSLILLGGLGIPVLADLLTYWRERQLSLHTRITLAVVLFLTLSGSIGIFVAEGRGGALLAETDPARRLALATFQSVSARTAGFGGIQPFDALSPASQLLMIVLMFVGCAPASMGGGITTGTFAVLVLALWAYVRGRPAPEVGGRSIGVQTVRRAAAVLTVSLLVVLIATWLILITHPGATLDQALFEVVSAFATCGLSLAFTGELSLFGQVIIALMMFWGRLGALTLVAAFAQQARRRVELPEEQVLIG